jgi:methyl-galactoside transport system permease protein
MHTKNIKSFVSQHMIYIVLVVLVISIALKNPDFLSIRILHDILLQSSTRAIIALGAGFILITAGTDLSAGRVEGLVQCCQHPCCKTKIMQDGFFRTWARSRSLSL